MNVINQWLDTLPIVWLVHDLQDRYRRNVDLDRGLLQVVLENWNVRHFRLKERLGDSAARNWLVQYCNGTVVLRRITSPPTYLQYQLEVIGHLSDSDFPYDVPVVVQPSRPLDFVAHDGALWILSQFIEGTDGGEAPVTNEAWEVGRFTGHYTRALQTFDAGGLDDLFPLKLFDSDAAAELLRSSERLQRGGDRRRLAASLGEHAAALLEAHRSILPEYGSLTARLPVVTIYNDWHRHNRIVRNGVIVGIIDFDSVMQAPAIVDFQNALMYVLAEGSDLDLAQVIAFTRGFSGVRPLTATEIALIHPTMIDRMVWLISEIVQEYTERGRSSREALGIRLIEVARWVIANERSITEVLLRYGPAGDPEAVAGPD